MRAVASAADDGLVRLFRRQPADGTPPAPGGAFAEWLLRQFAGGRPLAELPYSEVERLCANAGSLLVGAIYARPEAFEGAAAPRADLAQEAALLSRRTADGFKASLADRKNAVIAWPWDHIATKVAWEASRGQDTSEHALGVAIQGLGVAYAFRHRDQLEAVLGLWSQVAATVQTSTTAKPDLAKMGAEMFAAFEATEQPRRPLPA